MGLFRSDPVIRSVPVNLRTDDTHPTGKSNFSRKQLLIIIKNSRQESRSFGPLTDRESIDMF